MDEHERRAPGRGDAGEPVGTDGVGDSPLRPDERATYGTDQSAGDGSSDAAGAGPGSEPRPWAMVGILLLAVFIAILAWALVQPIL